MLSRGLDFGKHYCATFMYQQPNMGELPLSFLELWEDRIRKVLMI